MARVVSGIGSKLSHNHYSLTSPTSLIITLYILLFPPIAHPLLFTTTLFSVPHVIWSPLVSDLVHGNLFTINKFYCYQ